jgi:hypothetical protein
MVKVNPSCPLGRIEGNNPFRAEIVAIVTVVARTTGKAS